MRYLLSLPCRLQHLRVVHFSSTDLRDISYVLPQIMATVRNNGGTLLTLAIDINNEHVNDMLAVLATSCHNLQLFRRRHLINTAPAVAAAGNPRNGAPRPSWSKRAKATNNEMIW